MAADVENASFWDVAVVTSYLLVLDGFGIEVSLSEELFAVVSTGPSTCTEWLQPDAASKMAAIHNIRRLIKPPFSIMDLYPHLYPSRKFDLIFYKAP